MKKRSLFAIFASILMLFITSCGENTQTVEISEEDININEEESAEEEEIEDESGSVEDEKDSADGDDSASSGRYEKGIYEGTSWISEWLGMRYDQPEGFLLASDEELDAMIQAGSNLAFEDNTEAVLDYAKLTTVFELMVVAPAGVPTFSLAVERSPLSADEYMDAFDVMMSGFSAL